VVLSRRLHGPRHLEAAASRSRRTGIGGEAATAQHRTWPRRPAFPRSWAQSKIALALARAAGRGSAVRLAMAGPAAPALDRASDAAALPGLETVRRRATGDGLAARPGKERRRAASGSPAARRRGLNQPKPTGTAGEQPSQPTGSVQDARTASATDTHVTGTAAPVPARGDSRSSVNLLVSPVPGRSGPGQSGSAPPDRRPLGDRSMADFSAPPGRSAAIGPSGTGQWACGSPQRRHTDASTQGRRRRRPTPRRTRGQVAGSGRRMSSRHPFG